MNEEEIFIFFDKIENKKTINNDELKVLEKLSKHDEEVIRTEVAQLLILSKKTKAKSILIELCNDSDALVRANACDSLCIFHDLEVYEVLKNRFYRDDDDLVKEYALLSIGDIMLDLDLDNQEFEDFYMNILNKEYECRIYLASYRALCFLGKREYLNNIIDYVCHEDYRLRCTSIGMLGDVLDDKNYEKIKKLIAVLKEKEETVAVQSTINHISDMLRDYYDNE